LDGKGKEETEREVTRISFWLADLLDGIGGKPFGLDRHARVLPFLVLGFIVLHLFSSPVT
jgi:hypothetical protein